MLAVAVAWGVLARSCAGLIVLRLLLLSITSLDILIFEILVDWMVAARLVGVQLGPIAQCYYVCGNSSKWDISGVKPCVLAVCDYTGLANHLSLSMN